MKCTDCAYYWKEETDARPCCQFHTISSCWDIPPCEQEDIDRLDEIDRLEREELEREYAEE